MTCAVLLVQATIAPLLAQVTPAWLARVATAINTQLVRDVAPLYGGALGVRVGTSPTDIAPGEMAFTIVDALPDDPGAEAYHSAVGADVPFGFLALSTAQSLDDVSTGISHEMCETLGDSGVNLWADDQQGGEWARELCDAVEANSYSVALTDGGLSVLVSDFLYPAFFAPHALGPYCYTQANGLPGAYPSAAFATAANGYQVRRAATGAMVDVTARYMAQGESWQSVARWMAGRTGAPADVTGTPRPQRASKVQHWSSRVSRRLGRA